MVKMKRKVSLEIVKRSVKNDKVLIHNLQDIANLLRRDSIFMTTKAGSGHPSSCLSCAEIMSVLFFNEMSYNSKEAYALNNDEFMQSYHKRSNAESSVSAMKRKFGDSVRSKNWTAQVNEVLCKCIAFNLTCVIMEMFCSGVKPDFVLKGAI